MPRRRCALSTLRSMATAEDGPEHSPPSHLFQLSGALASPYRDHGEKSHRPQLETRQLGQRSKVGDSTTNKEYVGDVVVTTNYFY